MAYGSAFISRPDSAPWIETLAYAESVERLWLGKKWRWSANPRIRSSPSSMASARIVHHIPCVSHGAYAHLDDYARAVLRCRPDVAILSHGVSATCLAHRLTQHNIQALDLGSVGKMLARLLPGAPGEEGGKPDDR